MTIYGAQFVFKNHAAVGHGGNSMRDIKIRGMFRNLTSRNQIPGILEIKMDTLCIAISVAREKLTWVCLNIGYPKISGFMIFRFEMTCWSIKNFWMIPCI